MPWTRIGEWRYISTILALGTRWGRAVSFTPRRLFQRVRVRRSCRPVDWTTASYPLFSESVVQVLSDNAEKMSWCPIRHEPHVLRWWTSTCSKSTGKSFTKTRWYVAPVSLLVKMTAPKRWSRKMPSQTLMENRCWRHNDTLLSNDAVTTHTREKQTNVHDAHWPLHTAMLS
jgi:hypothetical protein